MWKALALSGLILASGPDGPSDELFDKLASAPDDAAAAQAEADVLDALLESGSATVDLLMSRAAGAVGGGVLGLARALFYRVILI